MKSFNFILTILLSTLFLSFNNIEIEFISLAQHVNYALVRLMILMKQLKNLEMKLILFLSFIKEYQSQMLKNISIHLENKKRKLLVYLMLVTNWPKY